MRCRRLLLWRERYLQPKYWAEEDGWGTPWLDQELIEVDRLLRRLGQPPSPETIPGKLNKLALDELPRLASRPAALTAEQITRLRFSIYEDDAYPQQNPEQPSIVATFRQLHWWLTSADSSLQLDTLDVRELLEEYPEDQGQEPYWTPSQHAVAFGTTTSVWGKKRASGLGVLHFAVDPAQFTDQVREAFLNAPFCGIYPPLLVNPWPSGEGLTVEVVLPAGRQRYAKKIAELVLHFSYYCSYPGLTCQIRQNQHLNRLCSVYWNPKTHIRPELLA